MAKKTSTLVVLGALALIVIAALAVYAIFFQTPQTALGGGQSSTGTPTGAGTYISTGSTTLRYAGSDELTGAAVTPTTATRVGPTGPYVASITTASPGDKLSVLLTAAGYHAAYIDSYTVPMAPTSTQPVVFKANGTVTIDFFNTNGVIATNAVANQTATVGGVYNLKIRMTGSSNKDTGNMRCILEGEAGTNISKIELTGFGAVKSTFGKPNSYSLLGANSATWIYDVSPIVGAVTPEGNLVITSNTGKSLAGSRVKVTCETIENFIDPNSGLVVQGVEDSNGLLQSAAVYSSTIYFV